MKKIIATVLAMVMALALCTVAFATNVAALDGNGYAGYNKAGNEITTGTVYGYEAVAAAFTKAIRKRFWRIFAARVRWNF